MEERLREETGALVGPTCSEESCVNHDLHQGVDDPAVLVFYENRRSRQDFDEPDFAIIALHMPVLPTAVWHDPRRRKDLAGTPGARVR